MELMQAHHQWASRPADERFGTLDELHAAVTKRDTASREDSWALEETSAQIDGGRMSLVLDNGRRLGLLSHWSTRQFLSHIKVPADFLPTIDPELAGKVVNNRIVNTIAEVEADEESRRGTTGRMLVQSTADDQIVKVRAFYGSRYARLEDRFITALLQKMLPPGWKNPVAFKDGEWGGELVPSGLYASDRDMFAFFISGGDALETGGEDVMHRGFFVWNSQVGSKDFGFTTFYMNRVCGNNIIWGANDVEQFRGKHTRGVASVFGGFDKFLERLNVAPDHDGFAAAVREAKAEIVASVAESQEEKSIETMRGMGFGKAETVAALTSIRREETAPEGTRFNWLQGYTSVARRLPNTDARVDLETRAAAILLPAGN